MQQDQQKPPEQFAIVELFGHQKIAGRIGEQALGGGSFVRVDVPELHQGEGKPPIPGFTRLYGNSAIYSMAFVDEETALAAAAQMRVQPIDDWSIKQAIKAMVPDKVRALLGDSRPVATADHRAEYATEELED